MDGRLTQEHLNQYMLLNVHKHLTDNIDPMNVEKIFVGRIERIINVWLLYLGVGGDPLNYGGYEKSAKGGLFLGV